MRGHGQSHRRVGSRNLLDRHRKIEHAHAGAAVAFGDLNAKHPEACERRDDLMRELACFVPGRCPRDDLAGAEVSHGFLKDLLFLTQLEIHRSLPVGCFWDATFGQLHWGQVRRGSWPER